MSKSLKIAQQLSESLKNLRLSAIHEYLEKITENAVKNSWRYVE